MTNSLVVVSNRVPDIRDGRPSTGGLATALSAAFTTGRGLWFGWSGQFAADPAGQAAIAAAENFDLATVDLRPEDYEGYYAGYANRTLWPLFHSRVDLVSFDRAWWAAYGRVNRQFAEALRPLVKPDSAIWIHDYHLLTCADHLRKAGLRNRIGFFLHIPWPAADLFATLPNHAELLEALSQFDRLGFQTERDLRNFLDYAVNVAGSESLGDGRLRHGQRELALGVYPIGVDAAAIAAESVSAPAVQHTALMGESLAGKDLVIAVDRLDYSKGLEQRLRAYDRFLELWPEHRGQVSMLQIAPPSRSDVPEYQQLRANVEKLLGHINGTHATYDWTPVRYVNQAHDMAALAALYRTARVALVTPLRDGMNLVAKEYIAAQDPADPGVLVLSRFAGAALQLKDALIVNPYDEEGVAAALRRALTMPLAERKVRWASCMKSVAGDSIGRWRDSFLADLCDPADESSDAQPVGAAA